MECATQVWALERLTVAAMDAWKMRRPQASSHTRVPAALLLHKEVAAPTGSRGRL